MTETVNFVKGIQSIFSIVLILYNKLVLHGVLILFFWGQNAIGMFLASAC
jgi:hypothetical protein